MIRKALLSIGAIMCAASASHAADIAPIIPAAPPAVVVPAPGYSFAGPYVGVGLGWEREDFCGPRPCDTEPPALYPNSMIVGGFAGYNVQRGFLVVGVDAFAGTVLPWGLTNSGGTETDNATVFKGFVRARAGVAFGPALIYGTAGLAAIAHNCPVCDGTGVGTGWALGGGGEFGVSEAISVRLDYTFSRIYNIEFPNGGTPGHTSHTVLLGLIYNFGR